MVAKKAKVSTPWLMGGALRIGGEGENPPPVAGEGGDAGPAAPAFRSATETGQAPPASPHLESIERSALPSWVPKPTMEKYTLVAGASSSDRKSRLVLKRGR